MATKMAMLMLLASWCAVTWAKPEGVLYVDPGNFLPPKYKPGDTITKTEFSDVDNALSDVLRAGKIAHGRRCAIGVANLGDDDLTAPAWYVSSGAMYSSTPYTIGPYQSGLTLFHKRQVSIIGTAGLLSYDIAGTAHKVAIMWEVPWNTLLYDVIFNVKVYHQNVPTDKKMYSQMKDYDLQTSSGWLERNEYGIKILASISENTHAKLFVSVDATDYDLHTGPQLATGCRRKLSWLGKYCWQECSPTGYCWVDRRCSTDDDCVGPLQCHDACKKQ